MRNAIFRVLGGLIGLLVAAFGILTLPVLYVAVPMARQLAARSGVHASVWMNVRASFMILLFLSAVAFIAFILLRFAIRGPKRSAPSRAVLPSHNSAL